MKKTLMIFAACCLAFSAQAQKPGRGMAPMKQVVTVGKVTEADDIQTRRYTGQIISPATVNLVARVSAELMKVGFKEGEFVRKGQLLYQLDSVRYEAGVKSAEAKIAEVKARLAYAESNYRRTDTLFSKQALSQDTMENTLSVLNAYKAALLEAEAALVTAKDDLRNTKIVAPIDGRIGVTNFTEGNYIMPSSGTLAKIIQVNPLRVCFSMSNRDLLSMFGDEGSLKANAQIRIRMADDSYYDKAGVVEFINNEANRKTDTIQIYVKFDNPDNKLIPGSTVAVVVSRKTGEKLPAVLPSALMHDSKGAYVYVVNDKNIVERRDVVPGSGIGSLLIIRQGLKTGENVVTDGMHKAMPGVEIEPDFQGEK